MGKITVFLIGAFLAVSVSAQDLVNGERKNLLQVTASIYPSVMLNHDVNNNYFAGHANYFFEDKYSFRGEIMHYIDAQGENRYLGKHTQIQAGFGRHFPVKRFDPYIYLSLGLSALSLDEQPRTFYQPVAGFIAGSHFQFSRFFYFFLEAQYQHMSDPLHKGPLDQLFFSGGLGFQILTRKSD